MKKFVIVFLLLFSVVCDAQVLGIGAQFIKKEKLQLSINSYTSVYQFNDKYSSVVFGLGSGFDYLSQGSTVSGLNMKPISLYLMKNNYSAFTFGARLDAGYNRGFGHGNGIVLTPNFYADASVYYFSMGYDYNVSRNEGQLYVRIGVGLTMGFLKSLINN
jgi:hypothetical protein